jgi:hypothetical protein
VSSKDRAPVLAQDIDALLLGFRELRCATVSHMALEDVKASLLEFQEVLQDQFLALSIAILGLLLAMIQTMIMLLSADLTVRATSAVLVVAVGIGLGSYLRTRLKTGQAIKLRRIAHDINSAHDAVNEYTVPKFTAQENLMPALDACHAENRITKERYGVLRERLEQTVSFFDKIIRTERRKLRRLESQEKTLGRKKTKKKKEEEKNA